MTFYLPERTPEDRAETDRILFNKPASFGERLKAQAEMTRIQKDLNSRSSQIERDYIAELTENLGEEFVSQDVPDPRKVPYERRHESLFEGVRRARALNPGEYTELPSSIEEFEEEVLRRRRAEFDEAQSVLDRAPPGSWAAELTGDVWAEVTTPQGAMMLSAGAAGGVRLLTTMAIEGSVAALDELRTMSDQFDVSEDLDTPAPRPAQQLAFAGAIGAGLGGLAAGAQRFLTYRQARDAATGERRPEDRGQLDFGREVQSAEEGQGSPRTQAERPAEAAPQGTLGAIVPSARAPEEVQISYELAGKIRDKPLSDDFMTDLRSVVAPLGDDIGVIITSGGQDRAGTPGARRTGSTRHDVDHTGHAHTADLVLTRDGRVVRPDEDKELYARFFHRAAPVFPGIGHYKWGVHVGGGSVAAWGPTTSARSLDPYFKQAIDAGRVGWKDWTAPPAPARQGAPAPEFQSYGTRRGYTSTGQVTAGDDMRVDVEYQVVDMASLTRASGDLQPRDRSRVSSDEQIAEIAAQLDPARLMPSPEADRGAPVVGPDNVIESGNGRVMAVQRAYERHPDRIDAYRQQIQAAGFEIPEGVERPVLVARRTSDLSDNDRRAFVRQANTSAIARMSATERARADAASIDADTVALFDPAQPMNSSANTAFARRALDSLSQAERSGLVDAKGQINAEGIQRIRQALFARAYDAPDILARFAETDAGEFRSLLDALELAAPEWAAMRAAVADGRLRPEFDITDHVLDAMRLIATAREIAAREGTTAAKVVEDLLSDVDLLEGALPPLTGALVRKFLVKGRAAPAEKIGDFLKRYAAEARKVGGTDAGLFGDGPGPLDVLKTLDQAAFGDLDELGVARVSRSEPADVPRVEPEAMPESAFAQGARSPEAEEADLAAIEALRSAEIGQSAFGPIVSGYKNDPQGAIARLMEDETGEVVDAFDHPDLGGIAFVFGNSKFGLKHIADKHGEGMLARVPEILRDGEFLGIGKTGDRAYIQMQGDDTATAVIRLDYDGDAKTWLVTAFDDQQGQIARQMRTSNEPSASASSKIPDATGQGEDTLPDHLLQDDAVTEALRSEIFARGAQDIEIELEDGTTVSAGQLLDDMDADEALETVISACGAKGGA